MTNPGEKVRREASPFSSSVGVRKIMNHFVGKFVFLLRKRSAPPGLSGGLASNKIRTRR